MITDRTKLGLRTIRTVRKATLPKRFYALRTLRTGRTAICKTMLFGFSQLRTLSRVAVRGFVRSAVRSSSFDIQRFMYLRPLRTLYIYQNYGGGYIYTLYIWDVLYREMPVRAGRSVRA